MPRRPLACGVCSCPPGRSSSRKARARIFGARRAVCRAAGLVVGRGSPPADLVAIAYESEPREGMIVNEALLVEIVRPGTGDPTAIGEVGEVVATSFNSDYPMIRLATGDLSAV